MSEARWRGSRTLPGDPLYQVTRFRSYWLVAWASHDGPFFKWQASLPGRILTIGRASSLHVAQVASVEWVRQRTEYHLGTEPAPSVPHGPSSSR